MPPVSFTYFFFHLNFWPTNVQTLCADLLKLEFKATKNSHKGAGILIPCLIFVILAILISISPPSNKGV